MTLPYPEPGIRLIRQDRIDEFAAKMREFQEELAEAVEHLDRHYSELKATARQRLGTLFNAGDYPESLRGPVRGRRSIFPSVEPPDYLQQLNPQLYEQECQRVQARFDEAVRLAEEAFTAELAKLVSHLTERLSGQEDGKPKIFRDSAVENLTEFFQRFRAAERPQQRAARPAWWPTPSGSSAASSRRPCATTPGCGSTWPRRCRGCRACWTACLVDRPRRNILRRPR